MISTFCPRGLCLLPFKVTSKMLANTRSVFKMVLRKSSRCRKCRFCVCSKYFRSILLLASLKRLEFNNNWKSQRIVFKNSCQRQIGVSLKLAPFNRKHVNESNHDRTNFSKLLNFCFCIENQV